MNDSLNALLTAAEAGAQIISVNKRLARHLAERYDRRQLESGTSAWARPLILPYGVWLASLVEQLGLGATQLTAIQELRLWETVIDEEAQHSGHALLQVAATARRASEAQRLLAQYRCDVEPAAAGDDQRAFLRWRSAFRQRLTTAGWRDDSETAALVSAHAAQLRLPPRLIFAGFDDPTPELDTLQEALRGAGATVEFWQPDAVAGQIGHFGAADPQEEVRCCARWARAILTNDPNASIGVVAPQLQRYQPLIETIFRAELDPAAAVGGDDAAEVFALSLGRSLASDGVIRAALRILALGRRVSCDELSWLLRSPYCGGAESERSARALADRDLRGRGQRHWGLDRLARIVSGNRSVPQFAALLRACETFVARQQRIQTPGFWAEAFADLLETVGWPGERTLSSREYQAVNRFKTTLAELVSLERVVPGFKAGEALAFLRRRATETVFQPEGGEGPIEVLGMLEAVGLRFEHLWILGLHEAALPQAPRPNPFLPLPLQREKGMPHADAARELRYAEQILTRVWASADQIVCSWPRQEAGVALRPSPLLNGLAELQPLLAEVADPARQLVRARPQLEQLLDVRGPALPPGRTVSGGTALLKDQALCPFRAFAHHRLRAEALDAPDLGLDSLARGTLIHTVLELFWAQTQSQAALLLLTLEEEQSRLAAAAAGALERFERRQQVSLPPATKRLESERLIRLASVWLVTERERPPFSIAVSEESHQVPLGRLAIRTKVDRIDQLTDGRLAIIDYKTGQVDPAQWLEERLTEPQLPVYCQLLAHDQIGAVLFARVRSKAQESGFRGLVRNPEDWPDPLRRAQVKLLALVPDGDFDAILQRWTTTLTALAEDFAVGNAIVDPVDPRQTCSFCDLVPLCRIHDAHPEAGRGDDD